MKEKAAAVIHALPMGWLRTACCDSPRAELPAPDRVTEHVALATCSGARREEG